MGNAYRHCALCMCTIFVVNVTFCESTINTSLERHVTITVRNMCNYMMTTGNIVTPVT